MNYSQFIFSIRQTLIDDEVKESRGITFDTFSLEIYSVSVPRMNFFFSFLFSKQSPLCLFKSDLHSRQKKKGKTF